MYDNTHSLFSTKALYVIIFISPLAQMQKFDQMEFFVPTPSDYGIDDVGFIYVPVACLNGTKSKKY